MPLSIGQSFTKLQGNSRVCVVFEPMWGLPYALYSFYQSLYMKARGVTDQELGILIALSFIAGALTSALAGPITDALGRRKTTLVFDLIGWPGSILVLIFADRFALFALAVILGSAVRIVGVSWNLLLIEDATPEERIIAFNLINIINTACGLATPLAGFFVRRMGLVAGERLLMGLAVGCMTAMILLRHRRLRETAVGREILADREKKTSRPRIGDYYRHLFRLLHAHPVRARIFWAVLFFNFYLPLGTFSSLYYAPFLTEYLHLDRGEISFLGLLNSLLILVGLVFLVPLVSTRKETAVRWGFGLQGTAVLFFFLIPRGHLAWTGLVVAVFALGFGLARPFLDALLAEATEGKDRAGLYGFFQLLVSLGSAACGVASGFLYHLHPAYLYGLALLFLLGSFVLLILPQKKTPSFLSFPR